MPFLGISTHNLHSVNYLSGTGLSSLLSSHQRVAICSDPRKNSSFSHLSLGIKLFYLSWSLSLLFEVLWCWEACRNTWTPSKKLVDFDWTNNALTLRGMRLNYIILQNFIALNKDKWPCQLTIFKFTIYYIEPLKNDHL